MRQNNCQHFIQKMALFSGGSHCMLLVIVFVIAACEPAFSGGQSCPAPDESLGQWRRWGNSWYRLTDKNEGYLGAKESCKRLGGEIAAPRSAEENTFFVGLAAGDFCYLWIACWKDGEQLLCNGRSQDFSNWGEGESHDESQRCVSLTCTSQSNFAVGKWLDVTCHAAANAFLAVCIIRPKSQPKYCFPTSETGQLVHQSLVGHTIRELTTPTVVGCGRACVDEPKCLSFNIKPNGQKLLCQLNNATRCDAPEDFHANTMYISLYSDDINVEIPPTTEQRTTPMQIPSCP